MDHAAALVAATFARTGSRRRPVERRLLRHPRLADRRHRRPPGARRPARRRHDHRPRGREARDGIEAATAAAQEGVLAAVGDDLDDEAAACAGWSQRGVDARAFPPDVRKR